MTNKKENKSYIYCIIFLLLLCAITTGLKIYNNYYDNLTRNELKKKIKTVSSKNIDSDNNGNLILMTGKLNYNKEELYDSLFGVNVNAPRLLRYVEVYQWYQYKTVNKKGKTVYKYEKIWSSDIIKSKKFKKKGHDNPSKKINKTVFFTHDTISIGEFKLSKKQKKKLDCATRLKLGSNNIITDKNYIIYDNYFTNSKNPEKPEIGDYRISYYYNNWKKVTILAVQNNNTFTDYITKKKEKINFINGETLNKEQLIDLLEPQK